MELDDWLHANKMTVTDFAKYLDISRNHLNSIVNKHIKPGKRLARDIILATQGQVTEKELMTVDIKDVA
jgi:predicted XRE-type DNA-binding protein